VLSVNQIGIKEGQTTFLKSADSHQSGRLHPGLMFKQIEMSLFLTVHALSAQPSGRGKQTSWPNPLHLRTKSPALPKFLRGVISPAQFISIDQSLQISGNEEN
jgi:hypothetical protein